MMKKVTTVLTTFLLATYGFSQQGVMKLSDCLNYSLQHSPYVTIANNSDKQFKYDKLDLYSSYLPKINGSVSVDDNLKVATTVIPSSSLGFQNFLPPGMTLPNMDKDIQMRMGLRYNNSASVQLDQKLIDVSSIIGINGMKEYKALSDMNKQKTLEDLMYDVAMSYYQVMIVDQKIKLLQDNKAQYDALIQIMQLQLNKGVIKQVDFNRVQVALNNITSQLSLVNISRDVALNRLKVMIGLPIDEPLQIDENESTLSNTSLPASVDPNVSNRIDYRIMQQNIKLQELNVNVTKNSFWPTLGVYARYGASSYSDKFADSWKKFYDFSTIGIKLTVPLFNGLKVNTAYHKQLIQLDNMKAQSKIMEENYKVEYLNSRSKLVEAHTSYSTNMENMNLAKEVYEVTNLSYQKGASSLSDFLNADFSYKEAQNNYLTSLINLLSSRLDFEKSKGNLANYLNAK